MHWSIELANQVLKKYSNKDRYTIASGISPSGSVHIGNYREFVTNYYVARALQNMGKNVRMIFSWDEFDRFRKVPKNFPSHINYADSIGKPYTEVPSPYPNFKSSADFFEQEFIRALEDLQMNEIPVQMIFQSAEYRSGRYNKNIIEAVSKRKQIYDIINSFKSAKTDGENKIKRDDYFPITIYCGVCGRDNTKILCYDEKTNMLEYECACGEKCKIDLKTADNVKLVWKVDWPMRWREEDVSFEAAGIDHHSKGGSFEVATEIARKIFGIEPPCSVCYGFIGIKGAGDMHSSSGNNYTPAQLLHVYEPELLRYLFAKYSPRDAFDFAFDDTIIRHYAEFDGGVTSTEDYIKTVYDLALFQKTKMNRVGFGTLTTVAPIAGFNKELTLKILTKTNVENLNNFHERFALAKYWLETFAPDKIYKPRTEFHQSYFDSLNDEQRQVLAKLKDYLQTLRTEKEIQEFLYSIINDESLTKKENQSRQQSYFKIFYNMLFGQDSGPRLYLYLASCDKNEFLHLLHP
ncbi:MAG: lysine--tRNA ligase [Christensenellaceae bacterium]|nr:lysine--tRNA ligase [Christensenellaceae bacterium]